MKQNDSSGKIYSDALLSIRWDGQTNANGYKLFLFTLHPSVHLLFQGNSKNISSFAF